ncbi:hypothetical protein [Thermovibrio sp.]
MAVYMCSKCGTLVENPSPPISGGCPAGGNHLWVKLCEGSLVFKEGLKPYQCRKCGALIYCSKPPVSSKCPAGGNHLWMRL